ncbi:SMP-30/gluconolactonase/LRE family protein [Paracoccus sp. TK19116]|uniref:SMP-30/gluconolactonase/LRE family protein n=1 Tax=Paracoccus albicereus TaxID=2922394 RepID=A0ABT1MV43_9RHOB|nr:SMP-30/gluconolactonase/LRE family protein [Paracoccus albicereus]MCQ0972170.1 SMP-30/gluconolactonase/LRE family protein [Paracoccus albicereus]
MKVFDDRICELGEGPIWHPERRQFFWFDILAGRLLTREDDKPREWSLGRMASAAGWVDRDRLLLGTETGLALFDLRDGSLAEIAPIDADDPTMRSNDGRADRQGGFWFGMMGKGGVTGRGAIHRFYRGETRPLITGISIPNAICFSADGRLAHYADTPTGKVWRLVLDADGWPEGEPMPYLDLSNQGLNPDGAVIDAEGAFCVACWGAGRVIRFAPDGRRLDDQPIGALQGSCPAFGGEDLRDMLVTSAYEGMDQPAADDGKTWIIRSRIPGLPEPQVKL